WGHEIALERYGAGGNLMEGTYFGDLAAGRLWLDYETANDPGTYGAFGRVKKTNILDVRPTKIGHVKDGVTWTEVDEYERSPLQKDAADGGAQRTTGNKTRACLFFNAPGAVDNCDSAGSKLKETSITWYDSLHGEYADGNLLAFPASTKTIDPAHGGVIAR